MSIHKISTSNEENKSYQLGYIKRACKFFKGIHVAAIQALQVPGFKVTLYAIYVEDLKTGRSWVILRRYSEFFHFRQKMRTALSSLGTLAECIEEIEELHTLKKKVMSLKFPNKFQLHLFDKKVASSRSKILYHFLDGLVNIINDFRYLNNYSHDDDSIDGLNAIKTLFIQFIGGSTSKCTFFCPEPIPQIKLQPGKRVVISRCGSLDTVVESDGTPEKNH